MCGATANVLEHFVIVGSKFGLDSRCISHICAVNASKEMIFLLPHFSAAHGFLPKSISNGVM